MELPYCVSSVVGLDRQWCAWPQHDRLFFPLFFCGRVQIPFSVVNFCFGIHLFVVELGVFFWCVFVVIVVVAVGVCFSSWLGKYFLHELEMG